MHSESYYLVNCNQQFLHVEVHVHVLLFTIQTRLGEEDQVLQNRLVTLNEEIKKLGKYARQTKFQKDKKVDRAPAKIPTLIVSRSRGTLVMPLESMQEDGHKVREEEKERKTSCRDSSGSQGGCISVMKHEGEHSPLSSGAEDDVFFT